MAKWGQGTVYKRGKTYWIKYYQNGKPYYESAKSAKYADAARLLAERMGKVAKGKQVGFRFDKVMLSELVQDLKDDYKLKGQGSPRTVHLENFFHGYRVVDITSSEITKYINYRKEYKAANATINRELAALKRMLNIGAKATPVKVDRVPHIQKLPEDNIKQGFFEHEDFYSFLANMPCYMKGIVSFAYWTGWRKGQIRKLKWSMVNIKERIISVPGTITKNKKPHTIYLNDPLLEVIKERRSQTRLDCPYVFHLDGRQIANFRREWNTACRKTGLGYGYRLSNEYAEEWERKNLRPGPTIHDFRRTAARNLIRSGVTENVAMKITGHKTRAIFDRYDIVTPDDLKMAAELQAQKINGYKNGYNSEKSTNRVAI